MIRFPSQIEALQRPVYSGPQGAGGQCLRIVLGIVVVLHRGREDRLVSVPPPSEPDVQISCIRLSG